MHLFYLDEAGDVKFGKRQTEHFVLSALAIPQHSWNAVFTAIQGFRKQLRDNLHIPIRKELHARDFLAGRGSVGDMTIAKGLRVHIGRRFLKLLATMAGRGAYVINVSVKNNPGQNSYDLAVDRMLNRIQRTLQAKDEQGILIFDQGKEALTTRITRRARVFNPVPSAFRTWTDGSLKKNITTERILADPFFRDSAHDYLIQAVDFIAYALLKFEEPPGERVLKYKLHKLFPLLEPVLFKPATKYDRLGIVRAPFERTP